MKKVYAQDKKVVKEKIQGKKAKEKTDRTLRSSKKDLEQSSSVSDTFCIICLEPYSERPQTIQSNIRWGEYSTRTTFRTTFDRYLVNRQLESVFSNKLLQKVNLTYL